MRAKPPDYRIDHIAEQLRPPFWGGFLLGEGITHPKFLQVL
jgi:hypothetical protein